MSFVRVAVMVGLILAGIVGLAMSVCGGGFTVAALLAVRTGTPDPLALLLLPLLSLLIGVVILMTVWRRFRTIWTGKD
jgi:hypothetical protein